MKERTLLMALILFAAMLVSATTTAEAAGQIMIRPVYGKVSLEFDVPNPFDDYKPHTGIDIAARRGTVIRAPSSGKVEATGWGFHGEGRYIVIRHKPGDLNQRRRYCPRETWTKYYHLDRIYVRPGQPVSQRQQIGTVGATGNASGPHLHFETRENGRYNKAINPRDYVDFGPLAAPSKNTKKPSKFLATTWAGIKSK